MSCFIENIFIRNFKSLRQISLENCARINLIIGKPNTGKSNILEALSLFSLPFLKENLKKKITQFIRCESLSELYHFGNTKDPILAVMGASTCVVKMNLDESLTIDANNGVTQHIYQVDKNLKVRFNRSKFEFPKIKRYIFPDKKNISKYHLFFPIPPDGHHFKNQERSLSETEQRVNFFKTVINSNTDSVLVLEEPDARCFLPKTTQISQEMILSSENQFFITTYSPFMIHDLLENAGNELAIFETTLVDFETVIRRLSEDELGDIFQKGVDLFTHKDSSL